LQGWLMPPSRAHLFHVEHWQPPGPVRLRDTVFHVEGTKLPRNAGRINHRVGGKVAPSPRVLASLGMTLALSFCQIEMFHVEQWRAVATRRRGGAPIALTQVGCFAWNTSKQGLLLSCPRPPARGLLGKSLRVKTATVRGGEVDLTVEKSKLFSCLIRN